MANISIRAGVMWVEIGHPTSFTPFLTTPHFSTIYYRNLESYLTLSAFADTL